MIELKTHLASFAEHRVEFPVPPPLHILTNISVAVRGGRIYGLIGSTDNVMCADGNFRPSPRAYPPKQPGGIPSNMTVHLAHFDDDFNIVSVNEVAMPEALIPKVEGPTYVGYRGWDSPCLIAWRDGLWISGCIMGTGAQPEAAIFLSHIGEDGPPHFDSVQRMLPILPVPTHAEKNWMPEVRDGELRFHYRLGTLITPEGTLTHPGGRADLGQFNGGAQVIPFKKGGLTIVHGFHRSTDPRTALRRYFHFFVTTNAAGSPLTISEPFTLTGAQVEIVTGLAYHPDGKRLMMSYGRIGANPDTNFQEHPHIATITLKDLEKVL